jgi:hypothetical protein
MAKRLTKEQKNQRFLIDIINKMFETAGYDVSYEDIKDRKDNWYTDWTMTVQQNEQWKKWGEEEIRKVFKYPKKVAQLEMGMISLNFGLKFSDFKYS